MNPQVAVGLGGVDATKKVVKHPKGYLRDSGLLHDLLHLRDQIDLLAHPRMGQSWEHIVINNDEAVRQLDDKLIGLPFAVL